MPCIKPETNSGGAQTETNSGGATAFSGPHKTEADCLQSCQEGACCEGTSCSVRPQCQCQGAGKVFKGIGTTCTPNPCVPCSCTKFADGSPCVAFALPASLKVTITNAWDGVADGVYTPSHRWAEDDYPAHGITARAIYDTRNLSTTPGRYLGVSVAMQCDNNAGALRYWYGVTVTVDIVAVSMFPSGTLAGTHFLNATQPCQGQTVDYNAYASPRTFHAVVECVPNPLP
jgi:hypothetical protein